VNAAETAYESKWDDIQIAENNLKRMTEGPGKVAAQKNIDKMKNARSQLGAKVNRLKDQLKRGV
jgi:predicted DNA-binding protein